MRPVHETCEPRPEVLSGELRDQIFAARLRDVIEGTADPVYGDARTFFENTWPTEGLRLLVQEVLGSVSGRDPNRNRFIRLETSFGGGKTHNLIALWHLAQGHREGVPEELVDPSWIPDSPWVTVGVVGSDLDPVKGLRHPDGIAPRTLWGEIAWQVGHARGDAAAAWELLRENDEKMVAPGTGTLEQLFGDEPAVIMIDELALHLRQAKAVTIPGTSENLAGQTVGFLMHLIEFVVSRPRIALVLTLADTSDAFGDETDLLRVELAELRSVTARQEKVIVPSVDTEIARIVTHRLFRRVDREAARAAADAWHAHYRELEEKKLELPASALRSEYRDRLEETYPFHPELLDVLTHRVATIPNFQKTRGALRLLARVIRRLWEKRPADASFICPHHVDLGDAGIKNELTSKLGRSVFQAVIEADIASPGGDAMAHAERIDERLIRDGYPPYASRLATTIFLHSLAQAAQAGIEPSELMLSVPHPGENAVLVEKVLATMTGEERGEPGTAFWFLHWDGRRYRFRTEPSLEKIIQDEVQVIGTLRSKQAVEEWIRRIWKAGVFRPVIFPAEAGDVPDDAGRPKLAILHFDAVQARQGLDAPPDLVRKLFHHAGAADGFRTYKNNVLFLVADEDQARRMVERARRLLAIERIADDPDRMNEFSEENRKRIRNLLESSRLDVRLAITRAYRHLFYPSGDSPADWEGLAHEVLPPPEQGEVKRDQAEVLVQLLAQLGKVQRADDPEMAPAWVRSKAWPRNRGSLSTMDLRREFAKRPGLRILLDEGALRRTIRTGVRLGTWVYCPPGADECYGKGSPEPTVELSDDALLYLPDAAEAAGIVTRGREKKAKEPARCPVCGNAPCTCGTGEEPGGGPEPASTTRLEAEGAPGQALAELSDACQDAGIGRLAQLSISVEGDDREGLQEVRSIGFAISQVAVPAHLHQVISAEFEGNDSFHLDFRGPWERYRLLKQGLESLLQAASSLHARTTVVFDFDRGLAVPSDEYDTIRSILSDLAIGRVRVTAEPLPEDGR